MEEVKLNIYSIIDGRKGFLIFLPLVLLCNFIPVIELMFFPLVFQLPLFIMVAFSKTIRIYTPIVFALIMGLRTGVLPISNYITLLLIQITNEGGDVIVFGALFITVIINFFLSLVINQFLNIFFLKKIDHKIDHTS